MDDYPAFSLDHSIPLLVTLGIPSAQPADFELDRSLRDQAFLLRSEEPALESDLAKELLRCIEDRDASKLPCNGRDAARRYRFRVKAAGRTFVLPPRLAALPEDFEPDVAGPPVLHSPFSPLSPLSSLYPDGILDSRWLQKHQDLVPSILLCFYSLAADPTLATLQDNKIKTDINRIRNLLSQSGYRTRLAVVLLGEQPLSSPHHHDGTQERLDTIRKGCGMDPKTFFFVPPQQPEEATALAQQQQQQQQLERVVENTLTTLYAQALEYYGDLARHAKKKKGRGVVPRPTVPPTVGTSQTLSLPGWNVRYDVKGAVFAEFRQDMDAALRSFELAYENLLGPEVLEAIPSWSPRWNEARMLADVVAVRCLRCLLWGARHTAAVRRWQYHRDRMADAVERLGRGTRNYGWQAWEARWAVVMADLIERADLLPPPAPPPQAPIAATTTTTSAVPTTLYLPPEKGVAGERLQPWELLHHVGYWYRRAAKHLYSRRSFAYAMPEEDRRSPDSSPASYVASRAFTYDTYMCPDPHEEYPLHRSGVDHSRLILDCLGRARSEFRARRQLRLAAEISLECARELAYQKSWQPTVELLEPLWRDMSFRREGWLDVAEDLSWTLRGAALQAGRPDLVVAIDWELLTDCFSKRPNWHYDLNKSLQGHAPEARVAVKTDDDTIISALSTRLLFKREEGGAGDTIEAQLSIASHARADSSPITLSQVQIRFSGSLRPILLRHEDAASQDSQGLVALSQVSLEETPRHGGEKDALPSLQGAANLTVKPRQTSVFVLHIPLREPGEASVESITLSLAGAGFALEHAIRRVQAGGKDAWFLSPSSRKRIARANAHAVRVLPRPPKLEIRPHAVADEYYTNEPIRLEFELFNAEDEDASAKIDVALVGEQQQGPTPPPPPPPPPSFRIRLGEDGESQVVTELLEEGQPQEQGTPARMLTTSVGAVETSRSVRLAVDLDGLPETARYELSLRVSYHLVSDPETSIVQTALFPLNVATPFEANYDLLPRLHPDPWPSLFDFAGIQDLEGDDDSSSSSIAVPRGLSQTWRLVTRYASFASENLRVVDLDLVIRAPPTVRCRLTRKENVPEESGGGRVVSPQTIEEASFDIVAQKMSLDDRSRAGLDVSFVVRWSRVSSSSTEAVVNTTILPVPRLNIFGVEPRVLASVSYPPPPLSTASEEEHEEDGPVLPIVLDVVIENASNHFLTFGLTMEPSDHFAFSGPKQTTLHVLPVSRRSASYRLVPLGSRGMWVRPGLVVRDKYFQKVLRVLPTEGMRLDKDGFLVWLPPAPGADGPASDTS